MSKIVSVEPDSKKNGVTIEELVETLRLAKQQMEKIGAQMEKGNIYIEDKIIKIDDLGAVKDEPNSISALFCFMTWNYPFTVSGILGTLGPLIENVKKHIEDAEDIQTDPLKTKKLRIEEEGPFSIPSSPPKDV